MPPRTPIPAEKRHLAQHKKGGENPQLTILPAHSSPHLLNNERSLVPGASSSSLLDNSRVCKVYNEYKICSMQREGPVGWAGFESMFIDWKPPPPILDRLSNVLVKRTVPISRNHGHPWLFFHFFFTCPHHNTQHKPRQAAAALP
jgi:hypothetical protein